MLENMKRFKIFTKAWIFSLALLGMGIGQPAVAETSVWDGSMVRFSKGNGSPENPFQINTAEEMAYLIAFYDHTLVYWNRKHFRLNKDLDMKSTQWTFGAASSESKTFRIHFDGQGHKISNIEINLQDSPKETHYGLFPQLGGDAEFESVIENLEIENIHYVRSTGNANGTYNWRIGGVVGQMYANSRISNCIVHGFSLADYGVDVNMRTGCYISACPLVGEIQHKFGDTERFYRERGIMIESCYGHGTADISHFHGVPGQVFTTDVQGQKQPDGYTYNGYTWHDIGGDDNSFTLFPVAVTPEMNGKKFEYEAYFNHVKGHTYTYKWTLDGKRFGSSTQSLVKVQPKPYVQRLGLVVYDNGQEAGSGAILVEPDQYNLTIESVIPTGDTYTVNGKMSTESGQSIGANDFEFSWQDVTEDYKEVAKTPKLTGAQNGHTYILIASHRVHKSAKFSIIKSFSKPIYVCNHGISAYEATSYTTDSKSYSIGNDNNDGLTPETAVRSLKRAYELLTPVDKGGSVGTNVIVIMGEYNDYNFTEFMDNRCTTRNPDYFVKDKPALITGRSDNFRNSRLLFGGLSIKLHADTRFEQINLHGSSFAIEGETDVAKVFACGNDLTMGYGIVINGYKTIDWTLGMTEGIFVPTMTIYGGVLNNNDPDYVSRENTITILSGTYGRVIAGDGYTLEMEKTGNMSGSPTHPIRTHIVCDAANYFDPYHNQYDVALIVGGQADGTVFADSKIEVRGTSRVGRIVGGNVAFGRAMPGRPADSFFGQCEITVKDGEVSEIFGTNLGRYGHILYPDELDHDSCVTYYYGRSIINIEGGTIHSNLYGGGLADVVGFGYDDQHHTNDPHIPYWKDGIIGFGRYPEAKGNIPLVQLRSDLLDLSQTELRINISGNAHLMGSVYGGSASYSGLLPTRQAGSQSGCVFADTYINMTGGQVDGYIYGGCLANLTYFDNSDLSNYPIVNGKQMDKMYFSRIGQMYGNSHIRITGGEVVGMVYGGGEGTYYRAVSETDLSNAADLIASTYGSTEVTIGGDASLHEYIFGGGNYSHVLRTGLEEKPELAGCVRVNINGGKLYGGIFGGGHGNKDAASDVRSIYARIDGNVNINVTGGAFMYNSNVPRYNIDKRLYGIYGGGMMTSTVFGNTNLNLEANPFPGAFKYTKGVNSDEDVVICGGGYDKDCLVRGRASVTVNSKANKVKIDKIYGGGFYGNVGSTDVNIISGKINTVYAGSRHGSVLGETNITVGTVDDALKLNSLIDIENVYGGNEAGGTVGTGNQDIHMKINGGLILNTY